VVLDAATRLIVGWSVNLSENVIAVGDALRHAVGQYGIPAILYGDNGAGETAKAMDCPIDGICARLGIDHRLGLPGKPQGHGIIERSWQTHAINAARKLAASRAKDVDAGTFRKVAASLAKGTARHQALGADRRNHSLTPEGTDLKQFVDGIEVMVHEYNTQHRHRGLPKRTDGKHMTPMEAFEASLTRPAGHAFKLSCARCSCLA
jgi:putative transposase